MKDAVIIAGVALVAVALYHRRQVMMAAPAQTTFAAGVTNTSGGGDTVIDVPSLATPPLLGMDAPTMQAQPVKMASPDALAFFDPLNY